MDSARIAALLAPFLVPPKSASVPALSQEQVRSISAYIAMLLRWNERINLTAVRRPEEIVTRHFGESLLLAQQLFPDAGSSAELVDLGSGAGFPGLPIGIYAARVHVTLIESNHKKAAFLREVVRGLGLTGVEVFCGRGRDFRPSSPVDVVTMRAVERFESALPEAAAMLAAGGRLALLIGSRQARRALELLPGFRWDEPVQVPNSTERVLLIGENQER